jgi:hypothetical protein
VLLRVVLVRVLLVLVTIDPRCVPRPLCCLVPLACGYHLVDTRLRSSLHLLVPHGLVKKVRMVSLHLRRLLDFTRH